MNYGLCQSHKSHLKIHVTYEPDTKIRYRLAGQASPLQPRNNGLLGFASMSTISA